MEDALLLTKADLAAVGILEHLFPALLLAEERAALRLLLLVLLLGRDRDSEALALPASPRPDILALRLLGPLGLPLGALVVVAVNVVLLCPRTVCRALARRSTRTRLFLRLIRVVKLAQRALGHALALHLADLAPTGLDERSRRALVAHRGARVADERRAAADVPAAIEGLAA